MISSDFRFDVRSKFRFNFISFILDFHIHTTPVKYLSHACRADRISESEAGLLHQGHYHSRPHGTASAEAAIAISARAARYSLQQAHYKCWSVMKEPLPSKEN